MDYRSIDFRKNPEFYRVGRGEQGVLSVEPYKSEILPHWRFRSVPVAKVSSRAIRQLFLAYQRQGDFVGMDMARKFMQMGFTRARRYANRSSGKKYDEAGKLLPLQFDPEKAKAADVFFKAWKRLESNGAYKKAKGEHRAKFG